MNSDVRRENRLTLNKLLKLKDEYSEKIMNSSILISVSSTYPRLEEFLLVILKRTFEIVHTKPDPKISYSCEIFCSISDRRTKGQFVQLGETNEKSIIISSLKIYSQLPVNLHPFIYFMVSCYAGPVVLKSILKDLIKENSEEIVFDYQQLVSSILNLNTEINVQECYLAGAGAIGNSFLYALSTFNVIGTMNICDPDVVSGGNLNRCLFFEESDIDKDKVNVLVEKAQPFFSKLKLIPVPYEMGNIPDKQQGAWLNKLIVGVDSRRTRRNLQTELPKEVFDASTTGIHEVVIHHNKVNAGRACLGCIYKKEQQEQAHEQHIADALGVKLEHVNNHFIDSEAAKLIALKYSIEPEKVLNLSYDTLFKQLCGEGKLMIENNVQVLAPLAFVSALAGGLLALRFFEEHQNSGKYNYWRVSPWSHLNFRLQQYRPIDPDCEICNNKDYQTVIHSIWGK